MAAYYCLRRTRANGRLCVAYGVRSKPYRIAAKMSNDNGKSWSDEIILREGARNREIRYPRMLQREDGKIITVYCFATPERREQFIEATIWKPE